MKPKTTIVLAVLLGVCIVLALFSSDLFSPAKPPDEETAADKPLFDPKPGKAATLRIESARGQFAFEKTDDKWRITEPIAAKAEKWRVDDVADVFKDLKARPASDDVDDDDAGLAAPRWTVTMTDEKGKAYKLLVGNPRPMASDETYVRPAGSKQTFLAKVDFAYKLDKSLSDFRNDTVLELEADDIVHLTVTAAESYELVKKDDQWSLVKPVSAPADKDEVKKVLDEIARVTASEFVEDTPKDLTLYGLDRPQLIAQVEMKPEQPTDANASTQPATQPAKPGKKHGLAIGKRVGDKLYAKLTDQPTVFKVSEDTLKDLQPKIVSLRVKKVLRIDAADVTAVELDLPAGKASLAKSGGAWKMTTPLTGPADSDTVQKLLDALAGLKAENFEDTPDAAQYRGLTQPAAKVTARLAGKDQAVTLLIGGKSPSGEMTFVKPASGLAVAVVKTADLADLLAEPATYWDRSILKLPADAKVTRLELRRTDATYTLARPDGDSDAWTLSSPLAAAADTDQVNKIIDHLEDFKADKIVHLGKAVPDSFAKAEGIMQVVVTTAQTPETPATKPATQPTTGPATQPAAAKPTPVTRTHQVTVARVGLHAYAWAKDAKVVTVGEFAPSLFNDLSADLRSKEIWEIDPNAIRAVRLLAGTDSLVLKKDGEKWTYATDPYVQLDAEKVNDYLKDIKELKAEKFAAHAAPADPKKFGLDKPWLTLELTDENGKKTAVTLSAKGATKTEDRYGTATTVPGVFEIAGDTIGKLSKKLADFKK